LFMRVVTLSDSHRASGRQWWRRGSGRKRLGFCVQRLSCRPFRRAAR